jgi:hypothetical protein
MYSPERLHEVRIAAKKLRYGLELASDSGLRQAAPHVRALKRTQDLLGRLHDLQVLQGHIADAQIATNTTRAGQRAALETLAAHVEGLCRHLHGTYLSSSTALRQMPDAIRTAVVPQLARTARRGRALKMKMPMSMPATKLTSGRTAAGRGSAREKSTLSHSSRAGR